MSTRGAFVSTGLSPKREPDLRSSDQAARDGRCRFADIRRSTCLRDWGGFIGPIVREAAGFPPPFPFVAYLPVRGGLIYGRSFAARSSQKELP